MDKKNVDSLFPYILLSAYLETTGDYPNMKTPWIIKEPARSSVLLVLTPAP